MKIKNNKSVVIAERDDILSEIIVYILIIGGGLYCLFDIRIENLFLKIFFVALIIFSSSVTIAGFVTGKILTFRKVIEKSKLPSLYWVTIIGNSIITIQLIWCLIRSIFS